MADKGINEDALEQEEEMAAALQERDEEQALSELDQESEVDELEDSSSEVIAVGQRANVDPEDVSLDNLELLMDVSLEVTVELGRREMKFGDILQLTKGSIVELNKLADDPLDIFVNRSKVAEGEVVVIDEHFGVRITKILNTERLRRLG